MVPKDPRHRSGMASPCPRRYCVGKLVYNALLRHSLYEAAKVTASSTTDSAGLLDRSRLAVPRLRSRSAAGRKTLVGLRRVGRGRRVSWWSDFFAALAKVVPTWPQPLAR